MSQDILVAITERENAIRQLDNTRSGQTVANIGRKFGIDSSNKPTVRGQINNQIAELRRFLPPDMSQTTTQPEQNNNLRNALIIGGVLALLLL